MASKEELRRIEAEKARIANERANERYKKVSQEADAKWLRESEKNRKEGNEPGCPLFILLFLVSIISLFGILS